MGKTKRINQEALVHYTETLVNIPSPTGYTKLVEEYLIKNAADKGIAYTHTRKGAVMYTFKAQQATSSVMCAAHVDALGAMVKEVRSETLEITPLGGSPVIYAIGDYCQIHTFEGDVYEGTILPNNPASHVNKKLNDLDLKFEHLGVRVDLPLHEGIKTLSDYVEVGNFVSFDPKFRYVNGFLKSRHLDDKASAAALLHIADLLNAGQIDMPYNVSLFFNISEETGQGISGFPDIDDLIVVDMGVVGNGVAGDEYHVSICAKDSSGPYNYDLTQQLIQLGKRHGIGYKIDTFPYYGSDGSAALRAGGDLRVALIGPGVSASHGYERTHISALVHTAELIVRYLEG